MDEKILSELRDIKKLLQALLETNMNLYRLMNQYNTEYLKEMEREGFSLEQ